MTPSEEEMIETVRRTVEAFSHGDFAPAIESAHPDIELVRAGGAGTLRGVTQLRGWMEPDAFDLQIVEPLDFRAVGTKVLGRFHNRVRGAGSGIETEAVIYGVWTFDGAGRVIRVELFLPHEEAEAREAAGLSE